MLRFFREKAAIIGWTIVILFGGTMFTSTLFFGGMFGGGDNAERRAPIREEGQLALIGTMPVNQEKYYEFLNNVVEQYRRSQQFSSISPEFAEIMQFTAFNQAMQYTVLLEGAKQANLEANKFELQAQLNSLYKLYDIKDKKALKAKLKEAGRTYKEFEARLKEDIIVQKFSKGLKDKVVVTDRDLENRYTRIRVAHILVKPNPETPEVDPLAEAEALYTALISGEKQFETAATEESDDDVTAKNAGELGWIRMGATVQSFEAVAFALDKGEISKPVKTPFGYHIIKLLDKEKIEKPKEFDPEKERQELTQFLQDRAVQSYIQGATADNLKIIDPVLQAYSAKIKGDYRAAINAYQKQVSDNPASPIPHYLLAKIYLMLKENDNAKTEFQRASIKGEMNQALDLPIIHIEFGRLLAEQKNRDDMYKAYDRAVALAGNDISVLNEMKSIFKQLGSKKRLENVEAEIARVEALQAAEQEGQSPQAPPEAVPSNAVN